MTEHPLCGECGKGVLLPFTSTDGRCVYFCTECRMRFSGYTQECIKDDEPIFSQKATYTKIDQGATASPDTEPQELSEPVVVEADEDPQLVVVEETPEGEGEDEPPEQVEVEENSEGEGEDEPLEQVEVEENSEGEGEDEPLEQVEVEETSEGEGEDEPLEQVEFEETSGSVVVEGTPEPTEVEADEAQQEGGEEDSPEGVETEGGDDSTETEVADDDDPDLEMPEIEIRTQNEDEPEPETEPPEAIPDEPSLGNGLDIDEPMLKKGAIGSEGDEVTDWDSNPGTKNDGGDKGEEEGEQPKENEDTSNIDAYKKMMQKYTNDG